VELCCLLISRGLLVVSELRFGAISRILENF
jgi:hypothetical protein